MAAEGPLIPYLRMATNLQQKLVEESAFVKTQEDTKKQREKVARGVRGKKGLRNTDQK